MGVQVSGVDDFFELRGHLMFLTSISCVLDGGEVSLVVGLVVRQWRGVCLRVVSVYERCQS